MNFKYLRQISEQHGLILGSGSPRRVRIMTQYGFPFKQIIPNIEEKINPGESPFQYAERLAVDKATAVGDNVEDGRVVIGCDTIVVLGDTILEKPVDEDDAFKILSMLSGEMHVVCSAIALYANDKVLVSGYETTDVFFNKVSPDQIRTYITTGEPMDKAGGYGIQGKGAFLVDSIRGNLDNVIGLPCQLLDSLARKTLDLL